jgi:hypothetical protein
MRLARVYSLSIRNLYLRIFSSRLFFSRSLFTSIRYVVEENTSRSIVSVSHILRRIYYIFFSILVEFDILIVMLIDQLVFLNE